MNVKVSEKQIVEILSHWILKGPLSGFVGVGGLLLPILESRIYRKHQSGANLTLLFGSYPPKNSLRLQDVGCYK